MTGRKFSLRHPCERSGRLEGTLSPEGYRKVEDGDWTTTSAPAGSQASLKMVPNEASTKALARWVGVSITVGCDVGTPFERTASFGLAAGMLANGSAVAAARQPGTTTTGRFEVVMNRLPGVGNFSVSEETQNGPCSGSFSSDLMPR